MFTWPDTNDLPVTLCVTYYKVDDLDVVKLAAAVACACFPQLLQSTPVHGWSDALSPPNPGLRRLNRLFTSGDVCFTSRLQPLPYRHQEMAPLRVMTCRTLHALKRSDWQRKRLRAGTQSKLIGMREQLLQSTPTCIDLIHRCRATRGYICKVYI
jgi:hypothetical protein